MKTNQCIYSTYCIASTCFYFPLFLVQDVAGEKIGFAHAELELINSSTKEKINKFDFLLALHSFSHILES